MKAVVIGGGLAGLAAALDLTDAGHGVTLLEARPTLGGAVQTLPEREGDPSPPPDNGQHVALGCCTEYLRFLERIGRAGSVERLRLRLPVIAKDGRVALLGAAPLDLLRYGHLSLAERVKVALVATRLGRLDPAAHDGETFGDLLRRVGSSQPGDRPLLGRLHPSGAEPPLGRGERRTRDLHRQDGDALGPGRERPAAADRAAR